MERFLWGGGFENKVREISDTLNLNVFALLSNTLGFNVIKRGIVG